MSETELLLSRALWILEAEFSHRQLSAHHVKAIGAVHEQIHRAMSLIKGHPVPATMSERTNALLSSMETRAAIDHARDF